MPYTCILTLSLSSLLACSSQIYAYDLTSCDMSCNLSHVPLHCQNKNKKKKKNKRKKNKSRKIDKEKEKC